MDDEPWWSRVSVGVGVVAFVVAIAARAAGVSPDVFWWIVLIGAMGFLLPAAEAPRVRAWYARRTRPVKNVALAASIVPPGAMGAIYLLWPSKDVWWLVTAAALPLALLLMLEGRDRDDDGRHDFSDLSGPPTAP